MKIFLFLFFFLWNIIWTEASCEEQNNCLNCVLNTTCGWCTATQQCLPGNVSGPINSKCLISWQWKNCISCNNFKDCRTCQQYSADCAWYDDGKCRPLGFIGIPKIVATCPCNEYSTCKSCLEDPICVWCQEDGICQQNNLNCPNGSPFNITIGCPCEANIACQTCFDDQQDCIWCESTNKCQNQGSSCNIIANNCESFCQSFSNSGCNICNNQPGCGWCPSNPAGSRCVDATRSSCMLQHNCPISCETHKYCDPCQDANCQWCISGRCAEVCGNETIKITCESYCDGYPDCPSCSNVLGCGWCDSISKCVDADKNNCAIVHTCPEPIPIPPSHCSFDAGAFVGGMFLAFGLVALGGGAYAFYRYKTGKKISYNELK